MRIIGLKRVHPILIVQFLIVDLGYCEVAFQAIYCRGCLPGTNTTPVGLST